MHDSQRSLASLSEDALGNVAATTLGAEKLSASNAKLVGEVLKNDDGFTRSPFGGYGDMNEGSTRPAAKNKCSLEL